MDHTTISLHVDISLCGSTFAVNGEGGSVGPRHDSYEMRDSFAIFPILAWSAHRVSALGNIAAREWPCGSAACADWKIEGGGKEEEEIEGKSGAKNLKSSCRG